MASALVTGGTVRVEGLRELLGAFGRMNPIMRRELQVELRGLAKVVAEKGQSFAVGQGLVGGLNDQHPGLLVDRIRPRVSGATVAVIDDAATISPKYPGGYPYPRRYEFEAGGARAFLRPAVDQSPGEAQIALERVFDRMVSESGFGTGGIL